MKLDLSSNKDFWAGIMFAGTGAGAMFVARNYPFGTSLHMGPGYFPMVLGGILIAFGIYVMLRGLRKNEKIQGNWSIRALVILPLSIVIFGVLMELAGFIPALAALVFISAASGREFRFVEVLLLTLFLGALSVALFIWGLGLPYPLIKGLA
ncbi:MAG: tripartite tricarboxylate transporter TctB family protein [Deltaproteobacteria bacterium]|nr:tripartite tricarboxylate transporter TctB family protein [Deltaproteobacteria bacterium]MDA8123562.1 tripartite tricarboxylate transporter TctB family protein [Deltaproteobacteria bacterium]